MVIDRIFIIFHALILTLPVNRQITKMDTSLDAAANGDEDAVKRVQLAFGPHGIEQIPIIKDNIAKINAGTMEASTKKPGEVDQEWGKAPDGTIKPVNGVTPFTPRNSEQEELKTGPVEFGSAFNRPLESQKGKKNAATVLHEAAHVFAHASDDHYTTGTKDMAPLGVKISGVKEQGGCTYPFFRRYWSGAYNYMCL
jgi:hypothetical protein